MKLLQTVFLTILVVCVTAQFNAPVLKPVQKVDIDQRCMDCLCHASSGCDLSLKCHNAGGGAYYCGPYVISWAYWHEAGRPGDRGGPHDFETCLNNKSCAEQTVRGYMSKYGRDCDRNGVVDCFDFARIHKLGYEACSSDSIFNTEFGKKFESCYVGYANDNIGNAGQSW